MAWPSTHILKPESRDYPTSIYDEEFGARFVRAAGLSSFPTWLEEFAGVPARCFAVGDSGTTCCSSGVGFGSNGRQPALPVRGAADAGAVAFRAHSAGVLRHRVPRARAVRRVALPADRGPTVPDPGAAVVADHAGAVRGRGGDRHDPVL